MRYLTPALFLLAALSLALTAAAPPARTTSRPATSRPTPIVNASDDAALTAALDTDVFAEGDVLSSGWSKSGKVLNIAFAGPDGKKPEAGKGLSAVVFSANRPAFDAAFNNDVAKSLLGAHVRMRGRITAYGGYDDKLKGSKQIILRKPEDLTILVAATTRP